MNQVKQSPRERRLLHSQRTLLRNDQVAEQTLSIQRHLSMVKLWTVLQALVVLGLIALGALWLLSTLKPEKPTPLYPATIHRDCAPWDGAAFTVSIAWREAATLYVSIYQSPEITHPVTFSFPDETMRIGNAYLLRPDGSPEQLAGKIFFERVHVGQSVEGRFDLISTRGQKFRGTFRAEWGSQMAYCG